MKNFIKPDFTNSNLNISATLAEFLGAPNKNATLPILKEELKKNYKNVVFICFDGLGIHPINRNIDKDDFLCKNIKQKLVSTFPSTTTNATNSLLMNKLPLEHGWFGWSLYFKDINRNIDIFLNKDSFTGEDVKIENSPLAKLDYYFDNANSDYKINTVFPPYVKVKNPQRNFYIENIEEFFSAIKNVCHKDGKQFIYAYYPEPDATMHYCGVSSVEAKTIIAEISKRVEELSKNVLDTLFIITADHGQVDIEGHVNLYEDKYLIEMLETYPFMESRAPAFIVKKGRKKQFETYFKNKYGKDFILFKTSKLLKQGFFGDFGDKQYLLGDYIAIGTYTHKQAVLFEHKPRFKGHHTSLTEEMEVPLILIGKEYAN